MRIIVKDISACSIASENSFNVLILIDNQECRFILTIEIDKIGDRELRRVTTDREFDDIFKYDIAIHSRICKLVSAVYNDRPIDLPCDVGDLEIDRDNLSSIPSNQSERDRQMHALASIRGFEETQERLHGNNLTENLSIEEEKSRQS